MPETKKIKVVSLINNLGPAGAERVLLQLAQNIDKSKFDFSVCCLEPDITLAKDFEAAGVKTTSLGIKKKYDPRVLWRLYRFLKDGDFDILHTHLPYAGTLGRVAGRLAGVSKIVSTEHNVAGSFKPLTRLMDFSTLFLADLVTCVAEEVEKSFFRGPTNPFHRNMSFGGVKHLTIYNGIDMEKIINVRRRVDTNAKKGELGIAEGEKIILNVARLINWKGHADLINAFAQISKEYPNARLLIAGWGPRENQLKKQASSLGLGDKVLFLGSRQDVYELLSISDIFVLPYNYNNLFKGGGVGIAILEAMSCGVPVITTDVPGIDQAIKDKDTGLLVPSGDHESLAQAMARLLKDGNYSRQIGQKGQELIKEKFSIKMITTQYEAVYDFLAKR